MKKYMLLFSLVLVVNTAFGQQPKLSALLIELETAVKWEAVDA